MNGWEGIVKGERNNGIVFKKKTLSSFQIIIFGFLAVYISGNTAFNAAFCIQGAGKRAISGCVIYSYIGYLCDRADRP